MHQALVSSKLTALSLLIHSFSYLSILITSQCVCKLVFIPMYHFWRSGFFPLSLPVFSLIHICKWHNQLSGVCLFVQVYKSVLFFSSGKWNGNEGVIFLISDERETGWTWKLSCFSTGRTSRGLMSENDHTHLQISLISVPPVSTLFHTHWFSCNMWVLSMMLLILAQIPCILRTTTIIK